MKNKVKELSLEELLDLAEESTDDSVDNGNDGLHKHVKAFILDYGIEPGDEVVPNYLIYYEYRRVWRSESRGKLSKIEFFRHFSKRFDIKRTKKQRGYLLNKGSFNLTSVSIKLSKDSDKIYENKIKKKREKKDKKKSSKVSKSK